jgi:hypothetical protein
MAKSAPWKTITHLDDSILEIFRSAVDKRTLDRCRSGLPCTADVGGVTDRSAFVFPIGETNVDLIAAAVDFRRRIDSDGRARDRRLAKIDRLIN